MHCLFKLRPRHYAQKVSFSANASIEVSLSSLQIVLHKALVKLPIQTQINLPTIFYHAHCLIVHTNSIRWH